MGEWRAKARGTQCPAEAGTVQHHGLQVKWGWWDSQTQPRCTRIYQICPEGPWGVLPASLDEGYGQAGGRRVGLAGQLLLSFPPSLQPWGRISAAVLSPQRGNPMAGESLMVADSCRQAAMVLSWILNSKCHPVLRSAPGHQTSYGHTHPHSGHPNWMLEG